MIAHLGAGCQGALWGPCPKKLSPSHQSSGRRIPSCESADWWWGSISLRRGYHCSRMPLPCFALLWVTQRSRCYSLVPGSSPTQKNSPPVLPFSSLLGWGGGGILPGTEPSLGFSAAANCTLHRQGRGQAVK